MIGASRTMDQVFDLAHGAAAAASPVLLVGESGTGKEMLARAIHRQGRRASGPFIAVDCAALPAESIEQELFGSTNGRPLAVAADGGTLFLADVARLPLSAQALLVQLLQRGELQRDPDRPAKPVDIRLVAATSRELRPEVDSGAVRRDLYFHLNALVIRIPPLRRRKDDIPLLAYHFLHRCSQRIGRTMRRISPEALRALRDHRWTGNVRELEHAMERAAALARSDVVLPADLAFLRGEQAASVVLEAGGEPRDTVFDPALFDLPYAEAGGGGLRSRVRPRLAQPYGRQRLGGGAPVGVGSFELSSGDEEGRTVNAQLGSALSKAVSTLLFRDSGHGIEDRRAVS
jgi:DNA-binding NtrC family response regulator